MAASRRVRSSSVLPGPGGGEQKRCQIRQNDQIPIELLGRHFSSSSHRHRSIDFVSFNRTLEITEDKTLQVVDPNPKLFLTLSFDYLANIQLDGALIPFNDAWSHLGYSREQLTKMSLMDLVHPEDVALTKIILNEIQLGKSPRAFANRIRKANGEYCNFEWKKVQDTSSTLIYAVAKDVTQQKWSKDMAACVSRIRSHNQFRSDDKIRHYQQILTEILQLTDCEFGFIGDIIDDDQGAFIHSLAVAKRMAPLPTDERYYLVPAKEIALSSLTELMGPTLGSGQITVRNVPLSKELERVWPAEYPPIASCLSVPIANHAGLFAVVFLANRQSGFSAEFYKRCEQVFGSISDQLCLAKVTQELELQKILFNRHNRLASLGEMIAAIGHEISSPVMILKAQLKKAASEACLQGSGSESVRQVFDKIVLNVKRIEDIITGVHGFTGFSSTQMHTIDLSALLDSTVAMFQELEYPRAFAFEFVFQANMQVQANPGKIQQLVLNLLKNARDAVEPCECPKVSLRAYIEGDSWILVVQDNGIGLPREMQKRIFEPFFTTKTGEKGTGLGLAVAKEIVKEHSGEIHLESRVGDGSVFTLKFPLAPAGSIPSVNDAANKDQTSKPSLSGRILIVDDEPELAEVLRELISGFGVEAVCVQNASEALELLKGDANGFSLVISDVAMPRMNGLELVRAIRSLKRPNLKVVLMSGYLSKALQENNEEVDGFLVKPFAEADVYEICQKLL